MDPIQAQAQLTAFILVGLVKLTVLTVRVLWRLLTRHAWVLLLGVMLAIQWGLLPPPASVPLVHTVVLFLAIWAAVWAMAHPAGRWLRAQRLRRAAARVLDEPRVQDWVTGRLPEGRARDGAVAVFGARSRWRRMRRRWKAGLPLGNSRPRRQDRPAGPGGSVPAPVAAGAVAGAATAPAHMPVASSGAVLVVAIFDGDDWKASFTAHSLDEARAAGDQMAAQFPAGRWEARYGQPTGVAPLAESGHRWPGAPVGVGS